MKHLVVYENAESFAGWPANNGIWNWNGEMFLVGFTIGSFSEKPGHNIDEPYHSLLARSTDQGDSWTAVEPKSFVGCNIESQPVQDEIDFHHPAFAMRIVGTAYHGSERVDGAFFISTDHGDNWQGPYSFGGLRDCPELTGLEITARTDYMIEGHHQCLIMMSARSGGLETDRTFCVRTCDGGRSFQFISWIVPPSDPHRAVMPSTVGCSSGELVSVLRRREPGTETCWIDAYKSNDAGHNWSFSGRVANTGGWNGNPPALATLADGRLCCVFGERDTCRMIATYSSDRGATWGPDIVLRDDFYRDQFNDPDLGYPQLVRRKDNKMMVCYYWATEERQQQHIAATIWTP